MSFLLFLRSLEKVKIPLSASSRKLSSDAVTQITTESPGKAMFSSQIFINADDGEREIPERSSQKLDKAPNKFASSSSIQQIAVPRDTNGGKRMWLHFRSDYLLLCVIILEICDCLFLVRKPNFTFKH